MGKVNSSKSQVASSKTNTTAAKVGTPTADKEVTPTADKEVTPPSDKEVKTGGVKPSTVLGDPKFKDFIEHYPKAYPKEKLFLVTSDWQVFLSANRAEAVEHQNGVDKDKAVCEYLTPGPSPTS